MQLQNKEPKIPFYKPVIIGTEQEEIKRYLNGTDGKPVNQCKEALSSILGTSSILLTGSCSQALEMAVRACGVGSGDEVILPSFTYTSAANAIASAGATPVFIDCEAKTFNIPPNNIETAINHKTKAVIVMHYGGVSSNLYEIQMLCKQHNLFLIEDAAQCIDAYLDEKHLGTFGDFGAISFHKTKNIHCFSGGVLIYNDENFRAQLHEMLYHGTNKLDFLNQMVDAYTWTNLGSSNYLNDLSAVFLNCQLKNLSKITSSRLRLWDKYHYMLKDLETKGYLTRPSEIYKSNNHNAHIYYIILRDSHILQEMKSYLLSYGIETAFHYQPLHSSRAGIRYGISSGDYSNTYVAAERLLRLPLFPTMQEEDIEEVVNSINSYFCE